MDDFKQNSADSAQAKASALRTLQLERAGISALETALQVVLKDHAAAAAVAAPVLELPAPIIERSIPFSNLVVRPASAARADLEPFFKVLAEQDPRIIGGKLPDDRFYAL